MPDMTSPLTHPQSKPTPHILKNIDGTVFKNIAGYIMLQELSGIYYIYLEIDLL